MLSARNPAGRSLLAWEATKDDGPFTCPECQAPVLLRKGEIKIHHFAHIPPTSCQYGTGESEIHRQAKMAIYQSLLSHPDVTRLKLERSLREVRPDVSCLIRGMAVAIEVQISHLSLTEIRRRTQAYASKNIAVLWTPPYVPALQASERYTPRIWEKFLHALYFKRVFYWYSDQILQPITFGVYMIDVPEASWYEPGGIEESVGGYSYPSKRYKMPQHLAPCQITDLGMIARPAWSSPTLSLPAAKLWSR